MNKEMGYYMVEGITRDGRYYSYPILDEEKCKKFCEKRIHGKNVKQEVTFGSKEQKLKMHNMEVMTDCIFTIKHVEDMPMCNVQHKSILTILFLY